MTATCFFNDCNNSVVPGSWKAAKTKSMLATCASVTVASGVAMRPTAAAMSVLATFARAMEVVPDSVEIPPSSCPGKEVAGDNVKTVDELLADFGALTCGKGLFDVPHIELDTILLMEF
ncbi:hypothetical protein AC1031_007489 [Aphanomyces cochlioides]|nr:hypothetical protein AC1031_007489 [Aphanomyces cochlioides]